MDAKGKLIVSTKSAAGGQKMISIIFSAVLILFGCLILFNSEMTHRMARDFLGDASMSGLITVIVAVLFFAFPLYYLYNSFVSARSYCDVYENGVTGVAGKVKGQKNLSMESFDISYDEIINVTDSKKVISIYTKYTTYEVLALKNKDIAVREIRSRAKGN